jgi:hypothetical protein
LVMFLMQRRSEAQPSRPAPAPAAPAAENSSSPALHHVQIRVLQPVTASLRIDDAAPVETPLQPNEPTNFDFSDQAVLTVSDGSVIQIEIDRNRVGALQAGPKTVRITASGVQLVR